MSAADSGATGLHFLVSTGVEKPDPALRKFIRSQVMIGKNRGKTRPVRKDRRKAIQEVPYQNPNQSPFEAWVHSNGDESLITPPKSSSTTPDLLLPLTVPRKFGSDMATMRFPDAVEPSTVDVFLKFSSIAKKILFPLESCVLFERKAEMWIAPLTFDAAFLHTMISMSHSYFDFVAGGRSSVLTKTTLHHFIKALKLLRERMSRDNDPITLSDSTTAAVMAFAGHALMMGDFNSAMNHMKGIHKIVGMRGGTSAFRSNPKLLTDILRCDIGIVLEHGSRPVFFRNTVHEDIPPYPDLTDLLELQERDRRTTYSRSPPTFLNDVDTNLSQAWTALAAFCSVTNFAIQSRQLISMETCLNTMTSVMYRLLSMRFESGSSDEAVRLSLLAFSSSIFLQWKPLGLPYSYFTSEFRECLMRLPSPHPSPRLLLWLVMVGAVSVFETSDDAWLRPLLVLNMDCCGIKSWDQMRDLLDSFMWIGLVHDKAARRKFDSTVACMNIQSP